MELRQPYRFSTKDIKVNDKVSTRQDKNVLRCKFSLTCKTYYSHALRSRFGFERCDSSGFVIDTIDSGLHNVPGWEEVSMVVGATEISSGGFLSKTIVSCGVSLNFPAMFTE